MMGDTCLFAPCDWTRSEEPAGAGATRRNTLYGARRSHLKPPGSSFEAHPKLFRRGHRAPQRLGLHFLLTDPRGKTQRNPMESPTVIVWKTSLPPRHAVRQ